MAQKKETRTIALNRQVRHEYFVDESFETGIELSGTEVKSLRAGTVNLKDSWVDISSGELIVRQMHISPYLRLPVHQVLEGYCLVFLFQ